MTTAKNNNNDILPHQELKSIELKAREIALGDEGYFAFHFQVSILFVIMFVIVFVFVFELVFVLLQLNTFSETKVTLLSIFR